MPSPFPCSPVICEWSWKKTQIEKKSNSTFTLASKNFGFGKYSLIYSKYFLLIQLLNGLLYLFHLIYFNSKLFLICFLQFFFVNFLSIKIVNNISPWHSIFNFFNHKSFFKPICRVTFCKNIFIFWYSNNTTNFKFRIFSWFSLIESMYALDFTSTGFILIVLWYVLLCLLTISST